MASEESRLGGVPRSNDRLMELSFDGNLPME
jgi:hypothetical protein